MQKINRFLTIFALILLGTSASFAQQNFSCKSRELCDWDGDTGTSSNCNSEEESSLFAINADETLFDHTTPTIKSTYYIKSKKKSGSILIYKVTSDVGNEYNYVFDPSKDEIRVTGGALGSKMVKFIVKSSWGGGSTSGGSSGGAGSSSASNECPSGASSNDFNEGDQVKILAISPDDAYVSDANDIVGLTATVGTDFSTKEGCWHGGNLVCSDGTTRYFYKVAIKSNGGGSASSKGDKNGPCPSNASSSNFSIGDKVTIVGISADDAYVSSASQLVGSTATVGTDFSLKEGCWYGGNLACSDGTSRFFYRVAIKGNSGGSASSKDDKNGPCPSGASSRNFSKGTKVTIVGISNDDAFNSDASTLVGMSATVDSEFSLKEGCWYGGNLICADGTTRYFYRVAVK